MPKIYCKDCEHFDKCVRGYMPDCPVYYPKKGMMTNEEWFCKLRTEEKAKWIFGLTYKCYWCGREYAKAKTYNEKECPFQKCMQNSKDFAKWLKEKHDGE